MGFIRGEEPKHRWLREDGYQLVWTTRNRLLVRIAPQCDWVRVRSPCDYHAAVIHALANGFKWVRELPGGDILVRDRRCRVRVERRGSGGGLTMTGTVAADNSWDERRHATPAVWGNEVKRQSLAWRAQREFRVRLHGLRVAAEEAMV